VAHATRAGGPTLEGVVIPPIPNPQSAIDNRHFPGRPAQQTPRASLNAPFASVTVPYASVTVSFASVTVSFASVTVPVCLDVAVSFRIPHSEFRISSLV